MTMPRPSAAIAAAILAACAAAAAAQSVPPADPRTGDGPATTATAQATTTIGTDAGASPAVEALDATARANLGADIQAGMAPVQLTPRPPGAEVTGSAVVDPGTDVDSRVTVSSLRPDSARGDYRIDFAALDADASGTLSRSEVAGNAELTREFDAVDADGDGALDRVELSGWQR